MCEVFIYCHRRGYLAVARLYLEGQCEKPQIVGRVTRSDSHAFVYLAVIIILFFYYSAKPESRKAMKKQENNHEENLLFSICVFARFICLGKRP